MTRATSTVTARGVTIEVTIETASLDVQNMAGEWATGHGAGEWIVEAVAHTITKGMEFLDLKPVGDESEEYIARSHAEMLIHDIRYIAMHCSHSGSDYKTPPDMIEHDHIHEPSTGGVRYCGPCQAWRVLNGTPHPEEPTDGE